MACEHSIASTASARLRKKPSTMPRAFLVKKLLHRPQKGSGSIKMRNKPNLGLFSIDNILNNLSDNKAKDEGMDRKENRNDEQSQTPEICQLLNKPISGSLNEDRKRNELDPLKPSNSFPTYEMTWPFGNLSQPYLALNYRLQQHLQTQTLHEAQKCGYQHLNQALNGIFPPIMPVSSGLLTPHPLKQSQYLYNKIGLDEPSYRDTSPPLVSPPIIAAADELSLSLQSMTSDISSKHQADVSPPNRQYACDACCKSYSTFSGLSKHKQFHCQHVVRKQFSCKYCDKVYGSLGALKMHIRTHTLPCKCGVCGKAFSRPWLLQGHIRTHTGEKPFSCQHCNRAFADRSNLRAHLQTHSDVKKYSCKNCPRTFSRMSLLLKHEDGGCTGQLLPKLY